MNVTDRGKKPNDVAKSVANNRSPTKAIRKALGILLLLLGANLIQAADLTQHFDIPRQRAGDALTALGQQASVTVIYRYEPINNYYTNPVIGRMTLPQAVTALLNNTGLKAEIGTGGHLIISLEKDQGINSMNTKKNVLAGTIAFFVGGGGFVVAQETENDDENTFVMEEIVVTASKSGVGENLQDSAIAISVLSNETIEARGLVNMNDYLATIPGASYVEIDATEKRVILRGLSTGPLDPQTVSSVYLGDIPLSSALNTFDINLVDIQQVEVVKGPQGTLYGSSSLGGVVRSIPVSPNLERVEGNVKADASFQDESDDLNNSLSGAINIPIIKDEMALRVVGYRFDNAGYVDIVGSAAVDAAVSASGATGVEKDDSGGSVSTGGRVSLLWLPVEDMRVGLTFGGQKDDVDGRNDVLTNSGDYTISYLNDEPSEKVSTEYASLVVEYDFGWTNILSSTSVLKNEGDEKLNSFPVMPNSFSGPIEADIDYDTDVMTQEIRMTFSEGEGWSALVGLFYEDASLEKRETGSWVGLEENPFGGFPFFFPLNPEFPEILSDGLTLLEYEQKAIFGEAAYQFSDYWELTLGGRYFEYDRIDSTSYLITAPFNGIDAEVDVSESGSTFKANLSYTPTDDVLIYTQWSEGFRLGRGQSLPPVDLCDVDGDGLLDFTDGVITSSVESDTTENIELGAKIALLENKLTVNTAVFRTDWDNLPVDIENTSDTCPGFLRVTNNIGEARSEGVEIEVFYSHDSWLLSFSASYIDTERKNVRPPLEEGESLIYSPESNASLGYQYHFPVKDLPSYYRVDVSYVGEYSSGPRHLDLDPAGDYVDVNMKVGVKYKDWDFSFYGKNITSNDDLRIQSNGRGDNRVGVRARPRRIGFEMSYNF